jgi:hypothetical protein
MRFPPHFGRERAPLVDDATVFHGSLGPRLSGISE